VGFAGWTALSLRQATQGSDSDSRAFWDSYTLVGEGDLASWQRSCSAKCNVPVFEVRRGPGFDAAGEGTFRGLAGHCDQCLEGWEQAGVVPNFVLELVG
jgi:hypothetical protein